MDCLQRQEASRKYAAEKISEIFPDVIALVQKKDKFSEVSHGLAVSSLAHGFSGGILFSEDHPEPTEGFVVDYTEVALTYAYRYAIRSGARGDDKENVVKGFYNGFKAGVKYGVQTQR